MNIFALDPLDSSIKEIPIAEYSHKLLQNPNSDFVCSSGSDADSALLALAGNRVAFSEKKSYSAAFHFAVVEKEKQFHLDSQYLSKRNG